MSTPYEPSKCFMARNTRLQLQKDINNHTLWIMSLFPENTRRSPNAGSMLGQRRRRWPSIEPAFRERLVFAGHSLAISLQRIRTASFRIQNKN